MSKLDLLAIHAVGFLGSCEGIGVGRKHLSWTGGYVKSSRSDLTGSIRDGCHSRSSRVLGLLGILSSVLPVCSQ